MFVCVTATCKLTCTSVLQITAVHIAGTFGTHAQINKCKTLITRFTLLQQCISKPFGCLFVFTNGATGGKKREEKQKKGGRGEWNSIDFKTPSQCSTTSTTYLSMLKQLSKNVMVASSQGTTKSSAATVVFGMRWSTSSSRLTGCKRRTSIQRRVETRRSTKQHESDDDTV